jgi:peptidoglycan hydrolase CwlO-like protein
MWLSTVAIVCALLLAGALSERPSWLSSTITAETTPSAPRSQPTGGSPPLAAARQQAESDALQQRADTLQAQISGLLQQADALQKEVAEQQQQLEQMSGLQQQADALQKEVAERKQELQQMVRRPHQPSIRRGAGDHQPKGVRRGQSNGQQQHQQASGGSPPRL